MLLAGEMSKTKWRDVQTDTSCQIVDLSVSPSHSLTLCGFTCCLFQKKDVQHKGHNSTFGGSGDYETGTTIIPHKP